MNTQNPFLGHHPPPALNEYNMYCFLSCSQEDIGDALVYTSLPIPLPLKRRLVEEWEAISNVSMSQALTLFVAHIQYFGLHSLVILL